MKDLGGEFGLIFGLISKLVLTELRFTDRPWRVREAKTIIGGVAGRRAKTVFGNFSTYARTKETYRGNLGSGEGGK